MPLRHDWPLHIKRFYYVPDTIIIFTYIVTMLKRVFIHGLLSLKEIRKFKRIAYGYNLITNIFFQLLAVSRTQQGRQREPSVKTLRFPLSHFPPISGGIVC